MAGRKIFVGSLPNIISDGQLRAEFGKYGLVEEVFIKPGCAEGRQWGFITFSSPEQAQLAKDSCDRVLTFPGCERPCDVMLAKNQGMFGQSAIDTQGGGPHFGTAPPPVQQHAVSAPKKIFVGSLPDGITDAPLRTEFSKYGVVQDIFIKPNCEPGRQWAFVSFMSSDQAAHASQLTNGILQFSGAARPCEVTLARNQGMFGQDSIASSPGLDGFGHAAQPVAVAYAPAAQQYNGHQTASLQAARKIFVGSLPDGITDGLLRAEFSKYGQIADMFIKTGCEPGRGWAFITFVSPEQALLAKETCDRVLVFPGSDRICEVTMARNQGMFGQEPISGEGVAQAAQPVYAVAAAPAQVVYAPAAQYAAAAPVAGAEGPRKIFVGSLPDSISDTILRAEFSKYGQIIDCFLKQGCETGRQWAFITFASPEQAQYAKDATDRVLTFPGSDRICEVMLAKNQGKFGQMPLAGGASNAAGGEMLLTAAGGYAVAAVAAQPGGEMQPPPPAAPPPAHLTPWRMYKTASGLPYYHNATTGVTQWEAPPDFQVPGQPEGAAAAVAGQRYAPY